MEEQICNKLKQLKFTQDPEDTMLTNLEAAPCLC